MALIKVTSPHLITAQNGPLFAFERTILENSTIIEDWFIKYFALTKANINSSVDLRHARYKLAPVDTNLFPAGFNNLNPDFMPMCVLAAQAVVQKQCANILILPENHTRNKFYLESLAVLRNIYTKAGFNVRIGNLDVTITDPIEYILDGYEKIIYEPLIRIDADKIGLVDFEPCLILLNNDLSTNIPVVLQNLKQNIQPSPLLGWSSRKKSDHFSIYNKLAAEFAEVIGIDKWLISTLFSSVNEVDFMLQVGIDELAFEVDKLLLTISEKYQKYGIKDKPFVVVKADSGTYGMGIMMVHSGDDIRSINRKNRTRMSMTKGRNKVTSVIIQEGVYSFETMHDSVCEPVIYMIGQYVVGGFYRAHQNLKIDDNLNAPGMHFEPLGFAEPSNSPQENRFYVYSVIARLASLAAAFELKSE